MQVTGPNGRSMDVSSDGYAQVDARTLRPIAQIAQTGGLAFAFASTSATGGTNVPIACVRNTLENYDLVIDEIEVSSDTAQLVNIQSSTGTPGGATAAKAKPLNLTGPTDLQTECYGNAAVTGTTDANIHAYVRLAANGRATVQFYGGLVVTPGTQEEVQFAASSVGDVVIRFYYRKRG